MNNSKVQSYLGFCIRAGKIVFGAEEAEKQKKGVYLLLMDESVGNSSQKSIFKAQENFRCPLLIVEKDYLGKLLHRPAVKAAAVKDEHLATAILSVVESEPQFKLYLGGSNEAHGKKV